MSEMIAQKHIERDPGPVSDLAFSFLGGPAVGAGAAFVLSEADAQIAAYAGYPDVIADIEQQTPETVVIAPDQPDEAPTPLHLHPGGRPKKLYEAESDAERQAIIAKTKYVAATTLGRSATARLTKSDF